MSTIIINPEEGHESGPEEALWYIAPYFEQARDYLASRNVPLTYLYKENAVKTTTWDEMARTKRTYIIAAGHGNETAFTGWLLDPIFWVDMTTEGFNPDWLKDTVFLVLSCLTAVNLGPWMVEKGAWSYLGWTSEYTFVVNPGTRKGANPTDSPDLLFFKPIEEAFERCAANLFSPKECFDYIYAKYTEYASDPSLPPDVRYLLIIDRDSMTLIGKKISPVVTAAAAPVFSFLASMVFTLGLVNIASGGKVIR